MRNARVAVQAVSFEEVFPPLVRASLGLLAGGLGGSGTLDGTGAAACDGAGNLLVTEAAHGIRKIATATGVVTTVVAGHAMSPEDSVISSPVIASDGAGNLYVDDRYVIQKVVIATGAVTTLMDATEAPFNTSARLAADGAGNLFLADDGATIRKIAIATGAVTTLAGAAPQPGSADGIGAAARFKSACGLATDGAGNVYVADGESDTVRKIVIGTMTVTTFAGAVGQPGNLYVADTNNHTVRRIAIETGTVSTVIGSLGSAGVGLGAFPASLSRPCAVVVLPTGELGIADAGENAVLIAHM